MTRVAIFGYGKGVAAVMAGTTSCPALHLFHADRFVVRPRLEQVRVTIAAAEHCRVDLVTEQYVAKILFFEDNVAGRVA